MRLLIIFILSISFLSCSRKNVSNMESNDSVRIVYISEKDTTSSKSKETQSFYDLSKVITNTITRDSVHIIEHCDGTKDTYRERVVTNNSDTTRFIKEEQKLRDSILIYKEKLDSLNQVKNSQRISVVTKTEIDWKLTIALSVIISIIFLVILFRLL